MDNWTDKLAEAIEADEKAEREQWDRLIRYLKSLEDRIAKLEQEAKPHE